MNTETFSVHYCSRFFGIISKLHVQEVLSWHCHPTTSLTPSIGPRSSDSYAETSHFNKLCTLLLLNCTVILFKHSTTKTIFSEWQACLAFTFQTIKLMFHRGIWPVNFFKTAVKPYLQFTVKCNDEAECVNCCTTYILHTTLKAILQVNWG